MPKRSAWKPRPGESELLDQIRVAAQQLDAEPGGRLGWVVRFAREDPARWLPADREAHGYRLLAFAHPLFANPPYAPFLVGGTDIHPLAPRDVVALQTELREKFRAFVSAPAVQDIEMDDGLQTVIVRATAPGVKPAIFGRYYRGPLHAKLWRAVADLVDTGGDRLISCPMCNEPFLALRKMKFCDPKCTQRWWDRDKVKKQASSRRGR